jgi:hypothetical protein
MIMRAFVDMNLLQSVPRFERMFDVEYPLPKLDTLTVRDGN